MGSTKIMWSQYDLLSGNRPLPFIPNNFPLYILKENFQDLSPPASFWLMNEDGATLVKLFRRLIPQKDDHGLPLSCSMQFMN